MNAVAEDATAFFWVTIVLRVIPWDQTEGMTID
ncbi:hypothetical protein Vspart_03665 [Vibrio spartinae]|uniref:Uncharacterized protein n=1 Tax=Vibrio spartinae TaxID=1918945 RepID=A0ABX6R418_9VIBR|nr:hypothetical protein Vspart_03665 [Vibrio spartinae]